MQKLLRIAALAATILVMLCLGAITAFAQDSTAVSVPWGDWLGGVLPIVALALLLLFVGVLGILIRFLPPWAQALADTAVKKQLIQLAADSLNWAVQSVSGATKGKELTVDVGNKTIAAAAQHAINTWPKAAIAKLGGETGVKKWVLTQAEDHGVILPTDGQAASVLNSAAVNAVRPR